MNAQPDQRDPLPATSLAALTAEAWRIGRRSAAANARPGLVIQLAALLLGVAYARSTGVRAALQHVSDLQAAWPIGFSFLSRSLFSGLLPFLLQLAIPALRPKHPLRTLAFTSIWWGMQGVILHFFYGGLARLYGETASWSTIAAKVATDMLLFAPLWGCPSNALSHLWHDNGFSWSRTRRSLGKGWYARMVLPNLLPAWALWTPAVIVIYSLPTLLQPHLAALIGCFWALMCLKIAALSKKT